MANYKGQSTYVTSWIILSLTAVVPNYVMSQTLLTSDAQQVCPGETVVFTCTTNGSSTLAWMSEEYIGSGSQLEFRSIIDPIGTNISSISNPETVANLTAINTNGVIILTSMLRIVARSTIPSISVSCLNVGDGRINTSTIPLSAVPGVPRNVKAAETSARIENNCIILVTWDPPASSNGSDIDHYIVYVPSRSITDIETFAITVLSIPNCHDDDGILVAAVSHFGCVGPNSSEVQPSLFFDNAQTAEGGSTTITPTEDGSASTSTSAVIAAAVVGAILIVVILVTTVIIVCFCISYKTGNKVQEETEIKLQEIQAGDKEAKQEEVSQQDVQKVYVIQYELEELYEALKSQRNSKIQVFARSLSTKLMKESLPWNESIKKAITNCLEKIRFESGEDLRKALNKLNSMIMDTGGIDKKIKENVLRLRIEAGNDKHGEVIDDMKSKVNMEEVQPAQIIEILLKLCEKLQEKMDEDVHYGALILQSDAKIKDNYYRKQSKHDIHDLGTEKDRVSVPIWIDDTLDDGWKCSLCEAIQAINEAAPGLSLLITEDKKGAIIHVQAIDKEVAYTDGNILKRSNPGNSHFVTKISLGKWEDDRKKGSSIHELLHALGFHHELQRSDTSSYVYHLDSGKKITIEGNWLCLTRFNPLSVMLYLCEKKTYEFKEHPEDPVWVLKADPAKKNRKLSELDKVGLNLVYPPCIDKTDDNVRYRPKLSKNGMYYCGRPFMSGRTYIGEYHTDGFCGPDDGPNCPACRTIKSPKVKVILGGGRWQGMTGLVYCGKQFTEPTSVGPYIVHEGNCGVNNGPACPDCDTILDEEMDLPQTASANK